MCRIPVQACMLHILSRGLVYLSYEVVRKEVGRSWICGTDVVVVSCSTRPFALMDPRFLVLHYMRLAAQHLLDSVVLMSRGEMAD